MPAYDEMTHEAKVACLGELAGAALANYRLSPAAPPVLINLSENATYRVDDRQTGLSYALRVHRDGYHSRNAIRSELAWLLALRADGVVITPIPVAGQNGELIQAVTHPAMARPRHVVMFTWEAGIEPTEEDHLLDKFELLGETAARMHLHSLAWQAPARFERHTWDFRTSLGDAPHWGRWRDGMGLDAKTTDLFARTVGAIEKRLARFGAAPARFGLIHSDMRLANLLIDGDTVKVLDFDDSGFSWHLYDAATAVSFFEHEPHVADLMSAWVAGYRRVRDLSREDEAEIPTFVMLRRLLLVAWIGSHFETDLARSMGVAYTQSSVDLCEGYLSRFG